MDAYKAAIEKSVRAHAKTNAIGLVLSLAGIAFAAYSIHWISVKSENEIQCKQAAETSGFEAYEDMPGPIQQLMKCICSIKWSPGRIITLILVCLLLVGYIGRALRCFGVIRKVMVATSLS